MPNRGLKYLFPLLLASTGMKLSATLIPKFGFNLNLAPTDGVKSNPIIPQHPSRASIPDHIVYPTLADMKKFVGRTLKKSYLSAAYNGTNNPSSISINILIPAPAPKNNLFTWTPCVVDIPIRKLSLFKCFEFPRELDASKSANPRYCTAPKVLVQKINAVIIAIIFFIFIFLTPPASPHWHYYIKKERESLYLLLVPLLEAVACALHSRTSNAEPHAV